MQRHLVLASTSPFRKELLARLGHPFDTVAPETDETPLPGELPQNMALRLSRLKAEAVAPAYPNALIIGSDQVAVCRNKIYGKPGSHERAVAQLNELSGNTVAFISGVCVLDTATKRAESRAISTQVTFRHLTKKTIEDYLLKEKPYNCAGSAKSEGLGIALVSRIESDDPTALIGLPLIALVDLFNIHGFEPI